MTRRLSLIFTRPSIALLAFAANHVFGCGQGSSTSTITPLPTLGGSALQVNALNNNGQMTGFSYTTGDLAAHAFLYTAGSMTDLGTLGGGMSQSVALNSSGQVVGDANLPGDASIDAFLYSDGTMTDLGTLGGSFSSASAINEAGQVAGTSLLADWTQQAFLYSGGTMLGLGDLGGGSSDAVAINQHGSVAGDSFTADFGYHAFLYTNGVMQDLGSLGGDYSSAYALNNADTVVGESSTPDWQTHAFVYSGGVMTDLGALGGTYSSASAVNELGQVIGVATTANDQETHGFIFSGGTMTDLGTLGGTYTTPLAINNAGQIVGNSGTQTGNSHAFLWKSGTMVDLNTLLPPNSGWELLSAQLVNDGGQIVGFGLLNGAFRWFVMTLATASANVPPLAVTGPDQTIDCSAQVTLDGSQSSDPDHDPLTYQWSTGGTVLGTTATLSVSLPQGINVVTLKVTDSCGASAQAGVTVRVLDTTPPTISCPAPSTAPSGPGCQAAVPNLLPLVVANDDCTPGQQLVLSQNPSAGTLVGLGEHPVVLSATDLSGNATTCVTLFRVADTTPPTISCPAASTAPSGPGCQAAVPNLLPLVVANDDCTPSQQLVLSQNPSAGTLVGLGEHSVIVSATDFSGNTATCVTLFKVVDTTPPTISCAAASTAPSGTGCQAAVPNLLPLVVANDDCTPSQQLVLSQNPSAGTLVGSGEHSIVVSATDLSGNTATCVTLFKVVDTTPPMIVSAPALAPVSADDNGVAPVPDVLSQIVVSDNCTPANLLVLAQTPAAGTLVGEGPHPIVFTVTDAAGNSSTGTFSFTVVDTTPPTMSGPTMLKVSVNANCLAAVPNVLPAIVAGDNCTPANLLVMTQSPAAGTMLAAGTYLLTVTATDHAGNHSTRGIMLTVADTTPPVISSLSASPGTLSSPNHQMVAVTVSVSASDNCDTAPVSKIVSITCNETPAAGEVQITGNLTANLAATRDPAGNGRIYTITVATTDASGNTSKGTVTVTVPKGNGNGNGKKP